MNEKETKRFFANKPNAPKRIRMSGKFSFSKFPVEIKTEIKKRLAEKDDVMARGLRGEIPGLKIDGKQVTRDNIKDFEITKMPKKVVKEKIVKKESKKVKPTGKELFAMNKAEQVKILKSLGVTKIPKLEKNRVKKILELI